MSLMFTPDELADLRREVLGLLPDTAVIERAAGTVDSSTGAWADVYAPAGTVVCRIDPIPLAMVGAGAIIAGQETARAWFQLSVPWDADIQANDRVTIGDVTFEIIQLHTDHSMRIVRRVVLSKLEH